VSNPCYNFETTIIKRILEQATGCGKTHTVSGTKEDPGIIYKTMKELFAQIDESADQWDTHVTVSFLEIYNELIRDLLSDDYPSCPRGGLSLREDEKNRITVAGLAQKIPKTADEVLEHVLLGNSRRTCSPTHANAESSRSHAVLQVNISRRSKGGDEVDVAAGTVTTAISSATLSIIDLAGSERASATLNMGNRMKEGANINKSLLALGNCINALCMPPSRGGTQHIPYRDSKLTRLLKFSLGGNCRTVMIVCVSPCSVHLEDTGNTLKYANRAKNIVTKVSRNVNGVERNITQYLKAIEEKNATIALLQAQLNEKNAEKTTAQSRKAAEAKKEFSKVIGDMRSKTESHLSPIVAGAQTRAMWDAAELRINIWQNRISHIAALPVASKAEEAESKVLKELIERDERKYGSNPQVQAKLREASTQSSFMDMLLRSMQEKRFDKLEESDVTNIRLEATLQKAESSRAQMEEREKAYRACIETQAEAVTVSIGALVRQSNAMMARAAELDDGEPIALLLKSLATEADTIINNLMEKEIVPMTSSATETSIAYDERHATCPVTYANPSDTYLSSPHRRLSTLPRSAIGPKPSPAIRRIAGQYGTSSSRIGSPVRAFFSPRKRSKPPLVGMLKPRPRDGVASERKKVTWRDEAGEGSIDETRNDSGRQVTSSEEESPPTTPTPVVETEDWIDDSEEPVLGDTFASESFLQSGAQLDKTLPDWKRNRLLGKSTVGRLANLTADSSIDTSPQPIKSGRTDRLTALGGPIRPGRASLAPLRPTEALRTSSAPNLAPLITNRRTSIVGTTYTKPKPFSFADPAPSLTKPAMSGSNRIASVNQGNSSLAVLPSRRLSVAGPMRTEKKRSRASLLPVFEDSDVAHNASHSKMFLNQILSPSKRNSPRKAPRRSSLKPPIPSSLGLGSKFSLSHKAGASSPRDSGPITLRAAMPTLSSQSKAVPISLRRLPSGPTISADSDRESGRSAIGTAKKALPEMRI
jgi:kinesin family protein 18/19